MDREKPQGELSVSGPPTGGKHHERHKRLCHKITRDGDFLGYAIKGEAGQWEAWRIKGKRLEHVGSFPFNEACERVAGDPRDPEAN